MMTFDFPCSECGRSNTADWRQAGRPMLCAGCRGSILVPVPCEVADPAAEQPASWRPVESIRLRCPGCGRKYSAKPAMAGRRIQCGGCGADVDVPGFAGTVPQRPARPEPAPRGSAPSPTRPRAVAATPPEFKFVVADDEPAPLRSPGVERPRPELLGSIPLPQSRLVFETAASDESTVVSSTVPSRKLFNLFATKPRDLDDLTADPWKLGKIVLAGTVCLVASVAIALKLGVLGFLIGVSGVLDRAELEQLIERDIALGNEVAAILTTIEDAPTAREAVPRIAATLDRLKAFYRENRVKKFFKHDVDTVAREYEHRQSAMHETTRREFERISEIPGASDAFKPLVASIEELQNLLPPESASDADADQRPFSRTPMAGYRLSLPAPPSPPQKPASPGHAPAVGVSF